MLSQRLTLAKAYEDPESHARSLPGTAFISAVAAL